MPAAADAAICLHSWGFPAAASEAVCAAWRLHLPDRACLSGHFRTPRRCREQPSPSGTGGFCGFCTHSLPHVACEPSTEAGLARLPRCRGAELGAAAGPLQYDPRSYLYVSSTAWSRFCGLPIRVCAR